MKKILLFFPDCPSNENNGAGIYFKNIVSFLNRYYNVHIYCLIGRLNISKNQISFIDNAIKNVTIINPLLPREYKNILNNISKNNLYFDEDKNKIYNTWKNYLVIRHKPIMSISYWYLLINRIVNDLSIDYTFIRDSSFLFYYNELCIYKKFKVNNLFFINIPPVINHVYYNHLTGNKMIFNDYKKYLKKSNLYESILITPCIKNINFSDYIYLPPMIFNNNLKKNIEPPNNIFIEETKSNIISFTGTLVDAQQIIQIINAFDRAITDNILQKNFILNITGKDVFSYEYKKKLQETISQINNKENIIINISKNGIDKNVIENIINESVVCIRLDTTREVISTKVLNYIKARKPIILQKLKVHEFLFEDDYPLYIDSDITQCENSIYKLFSKINNDLIKNCIEYVVKAYNKSNDTYLYDCNLKLKNLLGPKKEKKTDDIDNIYYTFKNSKWYLFKNKSNTKKNNKIKKNTIKNQYFKMKFIDSSGKIY